MPTDRPERSPARYRPRDPDLSEAVLDELYRYPRKSPRLAWLLWAATGFLGGHRFYLERTATGVVMLFTSGGLFVWWLLDGLKLRRMVDEYNEEQDRRERLGLPPAELSFMPSFDRRLLAGPPLWAARRSGRGRVVGDVLVLFLAGLLLGAVSRSTGNFEGTVAILVLIAVTVLGARWEELARRPVLRALDRWSHRLRLYYFVNDPGAPLSLLVRPVTGSFAALFRKRARAEARIYLQLGAVFVLLFTLIDLTQAIGDSGGTLAGTLRGLAREMGVTLIIIYAFASPIGATLTTHLLLERSDRTLWVLSGLTVFALTLGLLS